MFLNRISVKELDYFDLLRLDGKDAIFDVSPERIFLSCEGMQYDFNPADMKCSDVDVSKNPAEALEAFRANEVPLNSVSMREKGILKMFNMDDRVWLFAFASFQKHICLIRTGTFEKTIGEL
ncbi:hypothetical protein D0Q53_20690 [Salmonella enterica]|nr:hypothetical protein [Salmonella enterica]EFF4796146.1 hypothetical protein [Escherichia coli]EBL0923948.1 hypothetical protein [Salmonella enterica]ECO7324738.1 hypothetical protein [Salmonella enterica]ECZ0806973.1 hypothetical protein [Salmonella enterica]